MKRIVVLLVILNLVQNLNVIAQNIISNPGFETATVGLPGGTSLSAYPTVVNSWSAVNTDGEFLNNITLAHTGVGFLSVLQNPGGNPQTFWLGATAIGGGYDRAIQSIPVSPSTHYQLQFWLRSGDNLRYSGYAAGNLLVQVEQISPINTAIDSFSVYTPFSWQQSTFSFTTGSTCTSIAVLFSCFSTSAVDAWIDDMDLHSTLTEGINNDISEPLITIYPNPASSTFTIESTKYQVQSIKIYDALGREILSFDKLRMTQVESATIDISGVSKGIYFVEIKTEKGIVRKKFVKE